MTWARLAAAWAVALVAAGLALAALPAGALAAGERYVWELREEGEAGIYPNLSNRIERRLS